MFPHFVRGPRGVGSSRRRGRTAKEWDPRDEKPSEGWFETEIMANEIRILAVAGARPNFMKIAPLLREMHTREAFERYIREFSPVSPRADERYSEERDGEMADYLRGWGPALTKSR